jgi:hypothetical protein
MTTDSFRSSAALTMILMALTCAVGTQSSASGPWFGVRLPPRLGETAAVVVGARAPHPITLPADEPRAPELDGAAIRRDLETIVGFSIQSRQTKEVGAGQLWGRISGFPSSARTVAWAVEQFRAAGIVDAALQGITQDAKSSLWLPLAWEVRLLADPAFGPGSQDVVLESAMPVAPSPIAGDMFTAPIAFVGSSCL